MRVLVTGSSGRIGTRVCENLLVRGFEVRGFDRVSRPSGHPRHEEIIGNLDDASRVADAVLGMDAIIHLGAYMSWAPGDAGRLYRSNVDGTRVMVEAAVAAGVKRFVFASSGEVYPENDPLSLPITEDHCLRPNTTYGVTKLLGEKILRFHTLASGIEIVILRFGHTQDAAELLDENSFFSGPRFFLGPRIRQQEMFGNHRMASLLREHDPGCPAHILARNENGRPYCMHITETRDMVQGIIIALTRTEAAGKVFNLGSSHPVDFGWLVPRMAAATGYPVIEVNLPGPGVYYHTSNSRICKVLGFRPEWTIEAMLEDAIRHRWQRD